jgi:hypothetical protein
MFQNFLLYFIFVLSRNSSFSIGTVYRLDDLGSILFTIISKSALGPTQLILRVKWPECEADYSLPPAVDMVICCCVLMFSFWKECERIKESYLNDSLISP